MGMKIKNLDLVDLNLFYFYFGLVKIELKVTVGLGGGMRSTECHSSGLLVWSSTSNLLPVAACDCKIIVN